MRDLVDQDEASGCTNVFVCIDCKRLLYSELNASDTIQLELGTLIALLGIDVEQRID